MKNSDLNESDNILWLKFDFTENAKNVGPLSLPDGKKSYELKD
jgi:hypothetical protein